MSVATVSLSGARFFHSARRLLPRAHLLGWVDQAVVSATRLVLLVMVGRWATPAELGGYGVALSIIALLIATHESLITRPYSIQLHNIATRKEHAFSTLVLGVFLSLAACALAICALLFLQQLDQTHASIPILIALAAALPLTVLREHARRFSFAHLRIGVALLLDCAVAALTLLAVMVLARSGSLDAAKAIWVTGIACGLVFCGWLYSARAELSWDLGQLGATLRRSWAMGKWFLWSQLAMQAQGYIAPWLVLTIYSASTAGVLVACTTVVACTNPILFGYFNVLLPKFVRTLRDQGAHALRREAVMDALLLAAIMGMFALAIAAFGSDIMRLLYPAEAYVGAQRVLLVLSVAAWAGAIGAPAAIALSAAERARTVAHIMTGSALLSLVLIGALLPKFGLLGAAYGVLAGEVIAALGRWTQFLRLIPELSATSDQARQLQPGVTEAAQKPERAARVPSQADAVKAGVLPRVCAALERAGIPYCLLRDYGEWDVPGTADIDCIVPREIRAVDLLKVLEQEREFIGAEIVRFCGSYFVLATLPGDASRNFLVVDFVHDNEVDAVPLYSGAELLNTRRRHNGLYVPQPHIEFGSCLARAIAKRTLDARQIERLAELFLQEDAACVAQIGRHWSGSNAKILLSALRSNNWSVASSKISKLRRELITRSLIKSPLRVLSNKATAIRSRFARLIRPDGISLCVLGPDGAGKSTLVDLLAQKLASVFPRIVFLGFAPSPLAVLRGTKLDTGNPHGRPLRSSGISLLRAGYWLLYYVAERCILRFARARSSLILYDRHFIDILVDQARYRYGGPRWLLSLIVCVAAKPDVIVLLDAPADVLQLRKQEVPFIVTASQRNAYLNLVAGLSNGTILQATLPAPQLAENVVELVLKRMGAASESRLRTR